MTKETNLGNETHYNVFSYQPIEFISDCGFDFFIGNVIKYVARYKHKNGLEDIKKAHVYLTWIERRHSSLRQPLKCTSFEDAKFRLFTSQLDKDQSTIVSIICAYAWQNDYSCLKIIRDLLDKLEYSGQ